jgi:hypothetical protein
MEKKDKKSRAKSKSKSKEEKPQKKEAKKEKKNEETDDKVKRPKNAYFFFTAEHREEIKKNKPDLKQKEIFKELGELWKNLSDSKKKKYEDMAAKDKERYEKECKEKGIEKGGKNKKKAGAKKEIPD